MTIFRHKKNGKLYTIEYVTPRMILGSWYEAKPFRHSTPAFARKNHLSEGDVSSTFVAVASA